MPLVDIDGALEALLIRGSYDYVTIWDLEGAAADAIRQAVNPPTVWDQAVREASMLVLEAGLKRGLLTIGDLRDGRFVNWNVTIPDAVKAAKDRWPLGAKPLPYAFWMSVPSDRVNSGRSKDS